GLGNHPLVAGLTGVAVALACVGLLTPASTAPRFLGALIGGSIAALLAGAVVLLYLPVRAAALLAPGHADVIAWGDARHLGGLWALLSARTFTAKAAIVHTSASPEAYPFVLFDELGAVAPLLALAGIFFGLRTRAARVPVAAITLFAAAASVGALAAGFDPLNPDIRGYLLGALASFAVLAAVGWAALIAGLAAAVPGHARVRTGLAVAVPAAVFLFTVLRALPLPASVDLSDRRASDQAVEDLQSQLPPRAALATVHFETAFLLAYQRTVEGRRPDLAWVHLGFVRGEGYAARLRLDHPSLIPLLDSHARGPLTLDAARASARPLAFEPDDHLAPDLSRALRPQGSAWVLPWSGHASVAESPAPLWPAWTAEAVADRQVRGVLAHRALRDAALACRRGLPITARLRLAELASLVPHDLRARAVRAGCPIAAP
ncbi:MAG TPA: hypothetical protein VGG33_12745, partial [Polyangia bacterium]